MSLLLQAMLFEKYGGRLTVKDMADELDRAEGTIYNQVSAGTFEIPTYVEGGKRFADVRDVAAHFDKARKGAA